MGWSNPEIHSWCIDDVKVYNPLCNIQAVIKANAASNHLCAGDSVELVRDNPIGGTSFQWIHNQTNISGATHANYYATQPGVYSCYITDTCGYVYSNNLFIDTISAVTIPLIGALTYDSVYCPGFYNGGLYVSASANGNFFQWYKNGVALASATGSSINLTNANGGGDYYLTATNVCGTYISDTAHIDTGAVTTAVINPGFPFPACYPNSFMLVANDSAGFTHQWYRNNYTLGSGYTNDTLIHLASAGNYKCMIQATGTCPSYSNIIVVPASPINGATITATAVGDTSFCVGDSVELATTLFAGVNYQWKKNGVNINAATHQTYTAKAAGNYTVQVFDTICNTTSNSIQVITPCMQMIKAGNLALRNYYLTPNTNTNDFGTPLKNVLLYDVCGKLIKHLSGDTSLFQIYTLLRQTPGIYIMVMQSNGETVKSKLIIAD